MHKIKPVEGKLYVSILKEEEIKTQGSIVLPASAEKGQCVSVKILAVPDSLADKIKEGQVYRVAKGSYVIEDDQTAYVRSTDLEGELLA